MGLWTFSEYKEESGRAPFSEWVGSLEPGAKAFVDDRLLVMTGMSRWPPKWASSYRGTNKIIELRITFNKVQYRPLGIYSPWRRFDFVLLGGAVEKGKIRREIIKTVIQRQYRVEENQTYVRKYKFN